MNDQDTRAVEGPLYQPVKPAAWIRYCSDGSYEGPIADSDSRMNATRRKFWTPLYTPLQCRNEDFRPAAWRYVPSPAWGLPVLTESEEKAVGAAQSGIAVEPLYTQRQAFMLADMERKRYADLMIAVEQILDAGHMNHEDLAMLRAAWEQA